MYNDQCFSSLHLYIALRQGVKAISLLALSSLFSERYCSTGSHYLFIYSFNKSVILVLLTYSVMELHVLLFTLNTFYRHLRLFWSLVGFTISAGDVALQQCTITVQLGKLKYV